MIMTDNRWQTLRKMLILLSVFLIGIGILMRFYHIATNDFVFYDEGYYLNHNRLFAELIRHNPPHGLSEIVHVMYSYVRLSLASGKGLWFMLVDSRIFFGGLEAWFFPRVVAAVAGVLTLCLVYLFAKRYFNSRWVGLISVGLLAILPSHVFYSRIGLQEALSTFLFLSGFYLYLFPKEFGIRAFFAGVVHAAAFFSSYRLIILPILVAFSEVWTSLASGRRPNFRKYLWHTLTFFFLVFMIGNIHAGENTQITFAWMFHQAHLAQPQFELLNFLSFPYYIFRLESPFFGMLFFGNIYYLYRREWWNFFPSALACLQMILFSLPEEKAARYICVVTPFMVMAASSLVVFIFTGQKSKAVRVGLIVLSSLMFLTLLMKSLAIARIQSDYRTAMVYLTQRDPSAKVVATQPWILNLYVPNRKNVKNCPVRFEKLVHLYAQGYRYLLIDPQAYISWTEDELKFTHPLKGYLAFITSYIKPIKTYPHFNRTMLERFVFEHSESLARSLAFLRSHDETLGTLRIYDIRQCIDVIEERLIRYQKEKSKFSNSPNPLGRILGAVE